MEQITKMPNTDEYIKGVINLRGSIIVTLDLAIKLGFPSKKVDNDSRIIVTEIAGNPVGLIVDSTSEVIKIPEEKIREAPDLIKQKINADYITGVGILGERLLILLDLEKVFKTKDVNKIQSIHDENK